MFWELYLSLVLGCLVPIALLLPQPTQSRFLIPSLFPNFPPTIKFSNPSNISSADLPPGYLTKYLIWASAGADTVLSRKYFDSILKANGFHISSGSKDWIGKIRAFGTSHTRVLHFEKVDRKYDALPGYRLLDHKNKMARNIKKSVENFGKDFKFTFESYILPLETNQLKLVMKKHRDWVWIAKPANGYRGQGVFLIRNYAELENELKTVRRNNINKRYVVERYLTNPYLTPETNQTLQYRVFTLITSVLPLRVYTSYHEFIRLGAAPFNLSNSNSKSFCGFIFSSSKVNKCGRKYADVLKYFPEFTKEIFQPGEIQKIKTDSNDIIIKTLTTVLPKWEKLAMRKQFNNYNAFQMFSFDFLLDKNLKIYLLEINKAPLEYRTFGTAFVRYLPVVSRLNIVGFNLPPTIPIEIRKKLCADMELSQNNEASCIDSIVFNECPYKFPTVESLTPLGNLESYTEDTLKMLALAEDELQRSKHNDNIFQRIYPTADTRKYIKYMEKRTVNYNAAFIMADWEEKYDGKREEAIEHLKKKLNVANICNLS